MHLNSWWQIRVDEIIAPQKWVVVMKFRAFGLLTCKNTYKKWKVSIALQKIKKRYQKTEFHADFESIEKVVKKCPEKKL